MSPVVAKLYVTIKAGLLLGAELIWKSVELPSLGHVSLETG